jgi:hypothetical protein
MKKNKAIKILLVLEIVFVLGYSAYISPTLFLEARHKSKYYDYSYDGIVDPMDILKDWKLISKEQSKNAYKAFFQRLDHKITVACIGFSLETNRFSCVYILRDQVYFFIYNAKINCFERRDISKKTKKGFRHILIRALDGYSL